MVMHYWGSKVVCNWVAGATVGKAKKCETRELIEAGYICLFQLLNFLQETGNIVRYWRYTFLYYCHM